MYGLSVVKTPLLQSVQTIMADLRKPDMCNQICQNLVVSRSLATAGIVQGRPQYSINFLNPTVVLGVRDQLSFFVASSAISACAWPEAPSASPTSLTGLHPRRNVHGRSDNLLEHRLANNPGDRRRNRLFFLWKKHVDLKKNTQTIQGALKKIGGQWSTCPVYMVYMFYMFQWFFIPVMLYPD